MLEVDAAGGGHRVGGLHFKISSGVETTSTVLRVGYLGRGDDRGVLRLRRAVSLGRRLNLRVALDGGGGALVVGDVGLAFRYRGGV